MSVLEWLKIPLPVTVLRPSPRPSRRVRFLKELGAHEWAFDSVPIEKQRAAFLMSSRRSACAAVDAAASNAISSAGSIAPQGSIFPFLRSLHRCAVAKQERGGEARTLTARLAQGNGLLDRSKGVRAIWRRRVLPHALAHAREEHMNSAAIPISRLLAWLVLARALTYAASMKLPAPDHFPQRHVRNQKPANCRAFHRSRVPRRARPLPTRASEHPAPDRLLPLASIASPCGSGCNIICVAE